MDKDIAEQKKYYNLRWSKPNHLNNLQMQRLIIILQAFEKIQIKNANILDFGCGTGWLASILNKIGHTTGIDLSDKAIENAKRISPETKYISADVFEHKFSKGSFDVLVSQEVIEHLDDQEKYIGLSADYLKKGGYLIMTTPNAFNFTNWTEEQLNAWNMQPIENWLTQKQLKYLLSPHFEILEMKTFISGYGSKGIFRVIFSSKINKLLRLVKLAILYDNLMTRLGFGLHIFVLAKRR